MIESAIDKINKNGLCLGCGLCESVSGKKYVEMKLDENGFFRPFVKDINQQAEEIISRICPGINVINDIPMDKRQSIWGKIEKLYTGYSTDQEIRKKGSSGGVISALALFLLEEKIVDVVLQVGGDSNDYERNSLLVSRTREDVLKCASSRYAPALIFDKIFEILDNSEGKFCFIGKPCDISALKNFLNFYPLYKDRFCLTISIICAGMPSFNGTKALINDFKPTFPIKDLFYRGNGWPGFFSFIDANNKNYQKSYNDSWGKTLNRHLNFRCKICPDGIGLQADIAVGDAWETVDGYPDFSEKDGQSLVISRTGKAQKILQAASSANKIKLSYLEENKIAQMQPFQFARRTRIGARLLAFYIIKGRKVNFKNLKIWHNLRKSKPILLLQEFKGTMYRLILK